jgi:predicted methyltransferase
MVSKLPWRFVGLLSLLSCGLNGWASATTQVPDGVASALSDPRRPTEQVELDANRKPAVTVAFAGVKPGDHVADFMPGNAYFTRILSDVVGPSGHVYAFTPAEQIANCPARETAGTRAIARDSTYANVTVLTSTLANFQMPEKLDLIWTSQNYHDLHDSFLGPPDIAKLNAGFFSALKPGGVFLVIDHVAEAGSGLRDTETLHRIDPIQMRREIEAAGFVFEGEIDALRNPGDDHKRAVFDASIRGKTDQVVYRFRRPR